MTTLTEQFNSNNVTTWVGNTTAGTSVYPLQVATPERSEQTPMEWLDERIDEMREVAA